MGGWLMSNSNIANLVFPCAEGVFIWGCVNCRTECRYTRLLCWDVFGSMYIRLYMCLYVIYKYIYIVQMKLGEIGDNRAETWRYDPSKIINTVKPLMMYICMDHDVPTTQQLWARGGYWSVRNWDVHPWSRLRLKGLRNWGGALLANGESFLHLYASFVMGTEWVTLKGLRAKGKAQTLA